MGLTISTSDTRSAFLMGQGLTFQDADNMAANATNGAQTRFVVADQASGVLFRIVRGTAGTTNLVLKDSAGVDWFITVAPTTGALTSSATVVP